METIQRLLWTCSKVFYGHKRSVALLYSQSHKYSEGTEMNHKRTAKSFRVNYFYAELNLKFHNLLENKLSVAKKHSLFYNKSVCKKEKIVLNLFYLSFC